MPCDLYIIHPVSGATLLRDRPTESETRAGVQSDAISVIYGEYESHHANVRNTTSVGGEGRIQYA